MWGKGCIFINFVFYVESIFPTLDLICNTCRFLRISQWKKWPAAQSNLLVNYYICQ